MRVLFLIGWVSGNNFFGDKVPFPQEISQENREQFLNLTSTPLRTQNCQQWQRLYAKWPAAKESGGFDLLKAAVALNTGFCHLYQHQDHQALAYVTSAVGEFSGPEDFLKKHKTLGFLSQVKEAASSFAKAQLIEGVMHLRRAQILLARGLVPLTEVAQMQDPDRMQEIFSAQFSLLILGKFRENLEEALGVWSALMGTTGSYSGRTQVGFLSLEEGDPMISLRIFQGLSVFKESPPRRFDRASCQEGPCMEYYEGWTSPGFVRVMNADTPVSLEACTMAGLVHLVYGFGTPLTVHGDGNTQSVIAILTDQDTRKIKVSSSALLVEACVWHPEISSLERTAYWKAQPEWPGALKPVVARLNQEATRLARDLKTWRTAAPIRTVEEAAQTSRQTEALKYTSTTTPRPTPMTTKPPASPTQPPEDPKDQAEAEALREARRQAEEERRLLKSPWLQDPQVVQAQEKLEALKSERRELMAQHAFEHTKELTSQINKQERVLNAKITKAKAAYLANEEL